MDVSTVTLLYGVAAMVGIVTLIWLAIMLVASRVSQPVRFGFEGIRERFTRYALVAAWIPAALAMLGSLYYSRSRTTSPARCAVQRIAMYPLVLILGIAAWRATWACGSMPSPCRGGCRHLGLPLPARVVPQIDTGACTVGSPARRCGSGSSAS